MTAFDPARLLARTRSWIAVDKPAHLPCQATPDPSREHLQGQLEAWLSQQAQGEAVASTHLVHRLDAETSGVLLVATQHHAAGPLSALFSERSARKRYLAVVRAEGGRPLPDHGAVFDVRNFLAPRRGHKGRTVAVRSGGQPASTTFEVLARTDHEALVLASPHTGRTHQIRVHLADEGLPIVGDPLYAPQRGKARRMFLHAWSLALPCARLPDCDELHAADAKADANAEAADHAQVDARDPDTAREGWQSAVSGVRREADEVVITAAAPRSFVARFAADSPAETR